MIRGISKFREDLHSSSNPDPCSGQIQQYQAAQGLVKFWMCPRMMSPSIPWERVPVFDQSGGEKFLPFMWKKFPTFLLVSVDSHTVTAHFWGKSNFSFSITSLYSLESQPVIKWLCSVVLLRLKRPSSLHSYPLKFCSCPWTILVALHWTYSRMSVSILYWGAPNWAQHPKCSLTHCNPSSPGIQPCFLLS